MCGIAGIFFDQGSGVATACWQALEQANAATLHRGPDDGGVWLDVEGGIGLAHRRLSIIDLSSAGHQPMLSSGGRYAMVFNGEVYNHHALREEIERGGHAPLEGWRGSSDSETFLQYLAVHGAEAALRQADGMFALAVWDRQERCLTLARDRMGEKPLYYGWLEGTLVFASELKAVRAMSRDVEPFRHHVWQVDRDALALYMRHCYVPAPYCIYKGFRKLEPGCYLRINAEQHHMRELKPKAYWRLRDVAAAGLREPFGGSFEDGVQALNQQLLQSVASRMEADVPLGAFLSGGIDSSLIVSLMQAQSTRPVRTFTIGFEEASYNEAEHAKAVAAHLGTEHTELYVSPQQALDVIPRLPHIYDEPFSDSSQIPTFLVAEMTRRHVTVSLSGDAGDELFGGYNRYFTTEALWRKLAWCPRPLRKLGRAGMAAMPHSLWENLFELCKPALPSALRISNSGDRIGKVLDLLALESREQMYHSLVSQWRGARLVRGASEQVALFDFGRPPLSNASFTELMMYWDGMTYLPDDILVKVDRACMACSLESRVPFLDPKLIRMAWTLPESFKIAEGKGKRILREVLACYMPEELFERPKSGFAIPIDAWLRGPLREWAESLLEPKRMESQGYLDTALVQQKWHEHLEGKRRWHYELWGVLMFQAWLESEGMA